MKNLVLLLVLLVCVLAYVHAQQPATWNSWAVAAGANSLVIPAADADASVTDAASAPALPGPPPPARVVPVGGLIRNGNFVVGEGYWQGDGTADPSGKGVVITLSPTAWKCIYQTFASGADTLYSIEVTYKLSPGLTLSQNPADYANISKRLQISGFENYVSMDIPPNNFYGTIGDPSSGQITCEIYAPKLGTTDVQDYQHTYATIPPNGNKSFALAFPPGSGTVTLLTAFVTGR